MTIPRRTILKGLLAVPTAADQFAKSQATSSLIGGTMVGQPGPPSVSGPGRQTLADLFADHELARMKRQADMISGLDPDLAVRRQPLATIYRLQRARNFERIKNDQRFWHWYGDVVDKLRGVLG